MIINRNMKSYILQKNKKVQGKSGQWMDNWIDVKEIEVAIYPVNYTILTSGNIKYSESTNTGLSTEKEIEPIVNRIMYGEEIFEITFSNTIGKYTQLYLKKLIFNG